MNEVKDNQSAGRFELIEEGKLAYANYPIQGDVMVIPHVEADPALRGKGSAGGLMTGVLEEARRRNLRVRPICGYAAAFIRRHPEYASLEE